MREVRATADFARVRDLPRRTLDRCVAAEIARDLSPYFRAPGATCEFRPWQGFSLHEASENDGAFLVLPVGQGKTLIGEALPIIMNAVGRTALVLPASLRDKTLSDRRGLLRDGWRLASPPPRIFTMSGLQSEATRHDFARFAPRLIIIDEADEMANASASAPAFLDRYISSDDDVRVVCMTGTPGRKSIMNYWHLVCWALRDRAPMPMREGEAQTWAGALDDEGPRGDKIPRVRPGPLGKTRRDAREWYRRRLAETPGVVIVDEDSCAAPIVIRQVLAREDSTIDAHYERFLLEGENPGGIPVSDPLSRWRLDVQQMGSGLYSYWDPEPPPEWRDARRNVSRYVRDAIEGSRRDSRPLYTMGQVLRRHADAIPVAEWLAVKDLFDERRCTRTKWLSTSVVESAAAWLEASSVPSVVWCGSVEFAEALARLTRLPYYAGRGIDQRTRRALHNADPRRSMVCSWNANKRGQNLQAWGRQLICQPPPSAKYLEQIFGRAHRAGRTEAVEIDVMITSGGTLDGFDAAMSEAGFASDTLSVTQKILRADIVRAKPTITESNRFRWATR